MSEIPGDALRAEDAPLRLSQAPDIEWQFLVGYRLDATDAERAWSMYRESFEVMQTRAAQRHLMTRQEFDDIVADTRIDKILVERRADARIACMAIATTDLDAVPLVSPAHYRQAYPVEFAENRIWYIGFITVAPEAQGSSVMAAMIRYLVEVASREGGVLAADFCQYNEDNYRISAALHRIGQLFIPGIRRKHLDAQHYWAFEVPRA